MFLLGGMLKERLYLNKFEYNPNYCAVWGGGGRRVGKASAFSTFREPPAAGKGGPRQCPIDRGSMSFSEFNGCHLIYESHLLLKFDHVYSVCVIFC